MATLPTTEPASSSSFITSAVASINVLQTQYLLFALTVTVMILYAYNQTQEMKEIFLFCLGGFFTFINTNVKT